MESYCPFLESGPRRAGEAQYRCGVGVNFYSVGGGRDLCRTCLISDLGDTLLCERLEVYTFLQVEEGKQSVVVEMECPLKDRQLADFSECSKCPDFREGGGEGERQAVSLVGGL